MVVVVSLGHQKLVRNIFAELRLPGVNHLCQTRRVIPVERKAGLQLAGEHREVGIGVGRLEHPDIFVLIDGVEDEGVCKLRYRELAHLGQACLIVERLGEREIGIGEEMKSLFAAPKGFFGLFELGDVDR